MNAIKKKFGPAIRGLVLAFQNPSVQLQGILALCACIAGVLFHLTYVEWLVVILCIGIVIGCEILNTAIERTCDRITTAQDEQIRYIKDISAGAVLLSGILSLICAILILISHLA